MGAAPYPGVTSIAMLAGFSTVVTAQDWSRIVEDKARQRANRHAEETIEKGLDAAEDGVEMPEADLIRFFTDQGLTLDPSGHKLHFSKPAGNGEDFIDNLQGDPVEGFRIWRVPRK